MSSKVVQVTNIAPQATKDQMQNLFGCIGKIDEIRLYPTVRDVTCPVLSRICYVKFFESNAAQISQHLTNTVFIDRALIVCPVSNGVIPDEFKALEMTNNGSAVPGLPANDSKLPPEVVNRIEGLHPYQLIKTSDPKLEDNDLPEYPPLPVSFDARKIEEIRRTIIVIDIPADWELDEILKHFAQAGEVKFARFAEKSRQKYVMIEFVDQKSIIDALKMQGTEFLGKRLNIFHSMQAIIKPEAKSNEAAQREIEEAMSIVKEAHSMISAIDPVIGILASTKEKVTVSRRSRSRSRSSTRSRSKRSKSRKRSRRSRSRSHSKRKRSRSRSKRSRSKRRSASRSKSKRSRSRSKRPRSRDRDRRKRSRSRRRSRSASRKKSRTRSRDRRKSRSPHASRRKANRKEEKRRRSRTRSKSRSRARHSKSRSSHTKESSASSTTAASVSSSSKHREKEKERDRERERSTREKDRERERERRERSPSSSRSKESRKTRRTSEEKVIRERDYDAEEKIGTEDSKKDSSEEPSPEKSDNMDISNSP